jgi:hypothetical protein
VVGEIKFHPVRLGGAVPLTRSNENILLTMNGVRFLMQDGPTEVPCMATSDLLTDRFGSDGSNEGNEKAFRQNREAIERAASDKFDTGRVEARIDTRIILTAADMASPLSLKM